MYTKKFVQRLFNRNFHKSIHLILIFNLVSQSVFGVLSKQCLDGFVQASGYGNGWIKRSLVEDKVRQDAQALESHVGVERAAEVSRQQGNETYFYETYTCINCTRENSMKPNTKEDLHTCLGCGKPHSKESTYWKKINGEPVVHISDYITDAKELPHIKDLSWKCSHCGNMVPATQDHCGGCGGAHEKGDEVYIKHTESTEIKQEPGRDELPEVPSITAERTKEYTDPANHGKFARPKQEMKTDFEEEKPWWKKPKYIVSGLLGALGLGLGGRWLFATKDLAGTVSKMSWQHTIDIQNFNPVKKGDWCSDLSNSPHVMPVNGSGERAGISNINYLEERIHHYDKVFSHTKHFTVDVPYTVQIPYTDSETVSLGNGKSTTRPVTKYRSETRYKKENRSEDVYNDVPRYKRWCEYLTFEWQKVRTEMTQGVNPQSESELTVPEVKLGTHERSLPMERKYQVDFDYVQKKDNHTYNEVTNKPDEFLKWKTGEAVTVVKRNLGTVSEVRKGAPKGFSM